MISLFLYIKDNFYRPQDQMGFRDPATALMEQIIELHHFIFFFILLISGLVMWLLIQIIDNFIYLHYFNIKNNVSKSANLNKFLIYTYGILSSKTRFFKEDKKIVFFLIFFFLFIFLILTNQFSAQEIDGKEIAHQLARELAADLAIPDAIDSILSKFELDKKISESSDITEIDSEILMEIYSKILATRNRSSGYFFELVCTSPLEIERLIAGYRELILYENDVAYLEKIKEIGEDFLKKNYQKNTFFDNFKEILNNFFNFFGVNFEFETANSKNIKIEKIIKNNFFDTSHDLALERDNRRMNYVPMEHFTPQEKKLSEDFLKSDLNSLLENLKSNPKKIVKLDNFLQKNRIVFLNSEEESYKNFLKQIRNKIIKLYPKEFENEIAEKKILELCEIEAFRLNIKIQSITREVKVPEFLNSLEIRTLGAFTLEGFKEDFINSDTLALDIYDNFAGQFYLKSMETFYKRDSIEFKTLVELNNKKLLCSNSSFFLNFLVNLKLYKN